MALQLLCMHIICCLCVYTFRMQVLYVNHVLKIFWDSLGTYYNKFCILIPLICFLHSIAFAKFSDLGNTIISYAI